MGTDAPRSKRYGRFRSLFTALGVFLTLALAAGGLGAWTVTRSFPTLSGRFDVPGLAGEATVYRDSAGIPQIVAKTSADLFLAEGYVHAQDRFWEMDFRRHVTSGRLSELFGASEVGTDTLVRTLGWRATANQEVAALDPVTLGYYRAYADGVNAYLGTRRGADLSLEYAVLGLKNPGYTPEPWTPADSVAWLKAMAWDLSSSLDNDIDRALLAPILTPAEIAQLHPAYPYGAHPTIVGDAPAGSAAPPSTDALAGPAERAALAASLGQLRGALAPLPALLGRAGDASSAWVVSGTHTVTGKPLLATGSQPGAAVPSPWYQVGLRCRSVNADCPFDLAGDSVSGMPGVFTGHNARIAWGLSGMGADTADLYLEKVTGESYEYDGVRRPLAVRAEKIVVAGGAPVKIEIRSTGHGPILGGLGVPAQPVGPATAGSVPAGYRLSLQWAALAPGKTASAIFALDEATDWAGFRAAARLFDAPSQNLLYADVDGNIGYQAAGLIPVRTAGDGTLPVPGWTSGYGWSGDIPFDSLPRAFNPSSGFLVAAGNAPVGPDSRYLLTRDWDQGYRANEVTTRLRTLLEAGTPVTTGAMSSIRGDDHSSVAAALVPVLRRVRTTGKTREAQALFAGWNFDLDAGSAAAAYFGIVWRNLLNDMFGALPQGTAPAGGDRASSIVLAALGDPHSPWWTSERVGTVGRDGMLARALNQAAAEGVSLMGSTVSSWRWGSIHTLELTHVSLQASQVAPVAWLFDRGPYPRGGGPAVIDAAGWDAAPAGYAVDSAASTQQVVDLSNFDRSRWLSRTGASGHTFDPNYVDQALLGQRGRTRPWPFTLAAVIGSAANTLRLRPAPSPN